MPTFRYQSLTKSGQVRSGVVAAMDRTDAIRMLLERGETATQIEHADDESLSKRRAARRAAGTDTQQPIFSLAALGIGGKPTLSRSEMASLIRELATALEAGLPLMQALRTVRKQAHGRALPVILDHLIARVEAGDPLYKAAREYGPPFDDMVLGMLRAADAAGDMSQVLHQLSDLLERSVELRREVMGATFYPLLVAALIAVSVVVLVTVLMPRLIGPLTQDANFELPWPTAFVLNVADFFAAYWLYMIAGIGAAVIGWRMWVRVPANRYRVDLLKLKTPVFGRLLRDVAVARFTRTLGTLTTAGLPILESLRITQHTLVNRALVEALDDVQDKVTGGKSLAEPLERSGLFPPLLIQVVNLGERSGRLEQMLMHAATAFDRQVNVSLKLFTKALPPILLIIMATIVAFVITAILLPLLQLQSLVG